jgi:hypothetical protein
MGRGITEFAAMKRETDGESEEWHTTFFVTTDSKGVTAVTDFRCLEVADLEGVAGVTFCGFCGM